jgi:predicted permease
MNFFNDLAFTANAILPIILLILIGYLIKKIGFVSDSFIGGANKFMFRFALPVLLFLGVYNVGDLAEVNWFIPLFAVAGLIIIFVGALISASIFTKSNKQKGVIIQAAVRCNFAIVGLPLINLLTGGSAEAMAVAAIMVLFAVTTSNILSIIALTLFPKEDQFDEMGNIVKQRINWGYTLLTIIKNPLIIGILSGLVIVLVRPLFGGWTIREGVPFVFTTATWIGQMATPMALICLGAAFKFNAVKRLMGQIIHGAIWRLLIVPGVMLTLVIVLREHLNFTSDAFPAFIALFGAPIAVTSAVMAGQFNNDEELAAQLVVWTSIGSIITMFVIVMVFRGLGLLPY